MQVDTDKVKKKKGKTKSLLPSSEKVCFSDIHYILFLLYVNDIGNVLPAKIIKLYADDTNLFIFNQDIDVITITANEYLYRLTQLFIASKLSLNRGKTCLITVATQKQYDPIIMIDDSRLVNVDNCKYLGIYIDKDLKWTDHINQFCINCISMLGYFIDLELNFHRNVSKLFILLLFVLFCSMVSIIC